MAAPRKKKVLPRVRLATGIAAIPMKDFQNTKYYIHYELDKKSAMDITKPWIKKTFSKEDAKAILANAEYYFHMYSHYVTAILWETNGLEYPSAYKNIYEKAIEFYSSLIESGKEIAKNREKEAAAKGNVIVLSPRERLRAKVNKTIMVEIDDLEDEWMDGQKTEIDLYNRMRYHDLKGAAVDQVRRTIDGWMLDYSDAYHKKCEQAVEGYSHIGRAELKRRMKACETMLSDLDKLKAASKAVRTRVSKPKAADKQVARVKYCKENPDYKLVSINPVLIVGAARLFTFNVKTRMLTEYITMSPKGFEVSGTSIKKFDTEASRCTRLRKPDEVLPSIQSKTPKQIDNIFKGLSTKINVPNGRLNGDTVIIRALDK